MSRAGGRHPLRYFAPPALLVASALSLVLLVLELTRIVTGPLALVLSLVYLAPVLYAALLLALLLLRSSGERLRDRVTFAAVIAVMHYSWGAGFLRGVLLGARDAVDRSRIES